MLVVFGDLMTRLLDVAAQRRPDAHQDRTAARMHGEVPAGAGAPGAEH